MRTAVKAVVWTGVFAACAMAGALVAAHTDPFPPGVEDPGARPSRIDRALDPDAAQAWRGSLISETHHRFHVGGACRTIWRGSLQLTVDGTRIAGAGTLELRRGAECDFPVAQVQAKAIHISVGGLAGDGALRLRFTEQGRDPLGSHDLGGLVNTLRWIRPVLRVEDGSASPVRDRMRVKVPDGDQGAYASTSALSITCVDGC